MGRAGLGPPNMYVSQQRIVSALLQNQSINQIQTCTDAVMKRGGGGNSGFFPQKKEISRHLAV